MEAPVVNVGIMTEKAVSFVFHGEYVHTETGKFLTGEPRALFVNGNIVFNGKLFKEIFFEPASPTSSFELKAVTKAVTSTGNGKKTNASKGLSTWWPAKTELWSSTR